MRGLLTDVNIQGQVAALRLILEGDEWREIWQSLGISILTFPEVGLAQNATDAEVWRFCQQQQLVLLTGNRNNEGPDSLEATIRAENTSTCLPVFTLSDPEAVRHGRTYAEHAAARLLEYLMDIEGLRGTGRFFFP
jgi:Domain of unknown function (DUF5615)